MKRVSLRRKKHSKTVQPKVWGLGVPIHIKMSIMNEYLLLYPTGIREANYIDCMSIAYAHATSMGRARAHLTPLVALGHI